MTALRVVDTGVGPARWNVAITAALAELRRADEIPDVMRFHRYRPCLLLGRAQNAAAIERAGEIEIARRVTGGGAVYMDPGVLAWDIVVDAGDETLAAFSARIGAIVTSALAHLGVASCFRPPGDVRSHNRKICGFGGSFEGRTLVHQTSLLVAVDRDRMASVPGAFCDGEGPASRVIDLESCMARSPTIDEVRSCVIHEIQRQWRDVEQGETLDRAIIDLAERMLRDDIGTDAFVWGVDDVSREHPPRAQVMRA